MISSSSFSASFMSSSLMVIAWLIPLNLFIFQSSVKDRELGRALVGLLVGRHLLSQAG